MRRTLGQCTRIAAVVLILIMITFPMRHPAAAPIGFNIGDQVSLSVYSPALTGSDLVAYGEATVGTGVTFPSVAALGLGASLIDSAVTFSGNTITINYPVSEEGAQANISAFNGFVFSDLTQIDSNITSLGLVTNIAGLTAASLTSEFNSVAINLSGIQLPTLAPGFIQITAPLEPPFLKTYQQLQFYQNTANTDLALARGFLDSADKFPCDDNPICFGTLDTFAAVEYSQALYFQALANDPPDSNYTVIPTPIPPTPPTPSIPVTCASPTTLGTISNYLQTGTQVIGLLSAAQTAFNRAEGAVEANAPTYEQLQLNAGNLYTSEAEADTLTIAEDLKSFIPQLSTSCFPLAATLSVSGILAEEQQGFPASETTSLADLGLSSADIAQLTQLIDTQDPSFIAGNYPTEFLADANQLVASDPLAAPEPSGSAVLCSALFMLGVWRTYSQISRGRKAAAKPNITPAIIV